MAGYEPQPGGSLLEESDGPVLAGLGNWLAESLDVSELEPKQVLLLYMILNRCLEQLWRTFPEVLMPLFVRLAAGFEEDDEG